MTDVLMATLLNLFAMDHREDVEDCVEECAEEYESEIRSCPLLYGEADEADDLIRCIRRSADSYNDCKDDCGDG